MSRISESCTRLGGQQFASATITPTHSLINAFLKYPIKNTTIHCPKASELSINFSRGEGGGVNHPLLPCVLMHVAWPHHLQTARYDPDTAH